MKTDCAKAPDWKRGFTLIELLVVMAIIALLSAMLLPALSRTKAAARQNRCLNQIRQLALATVLYAEDHQDEFPRSQHSMVVYRQQSWGFALLPYLGYRSLNAHSPGWPAVFNGIYRCPEDRRTNEWSYGLNVYFELGPDDDYRGWPETWRKISRVPKPVDTILFGELNGSADHIMAHFWADGAIPEVATKRHAGRSAYGFVDTHVKTMPFNQTYKPENCLDLWHPKGGQ